MNGPPAPHSLNSLRDTFFARAVDQHATLLYRLAYSVLRNAADAEDAVADALLKLLRTGAWETVSNERAFLARTVWRTALDRAGRRPVATSSGLAEEGVGRHLVDAGPSPEERSIAAELTALLAHWIDDLPPDLRAPLLLSAMDALNSREIGDILELPEGTVRTRLMRARTTLRERYHAHHPSPQDRAVAVGDVTR